MAHPGEQVAGGRLLDGLAGVHDHDLVGPSGDHTEVVGDQDHRHEPLLLLEPEQVEDLVLHGDVERRGGFVGEEHAGATGQGDGDAHPLAHTARQLVRVDVEAFLGFGDADAAQQLDPGHLGLVLRDAEVIAQVLGDLAADLHHRIE